MHRIADGVWQLPGFPRDLFNVYLVGDTLIDTGTRWAADRILRAGGVPYVVSTRLCRA